MEREHCIHSAREHRNCTNRKIRRIETKLCKGRFTDKTNNLWGT